MKLLSISSVSDILSICLCEGENLIESFNSKNNRQHAELIVPSIQKILTKSSLDINQLDGICINIGPGSFTGLRVGLSTAKGIAFGANLNLYCYTNFEELVYQTLMKNHLDGRYAVLIPSRKNEFYFGAYDVSGSNFVQLDNFELMKLDEFIHHSHNFDWIITDTKSKKLFESQSFVERILVTENDSFYGAKLIQSNPQKFHCKDYTYLEPLYLKNFEIRY